MKTRKLHKTAIKYGFLLMFLIVFSIPLPWLVITAFNSLGQTFYGPVTFTFDNFSAVFQEYRLMNSILNSLIISIVTATLTTCISLMSAYAIVRLNPPKKHYYLGLLTFCLFLPFSTIMIPVYAIASVLRLTNTYSGPAIIICAFELPFFIWFSKAVIERLPNELEDMSQLDGFSSLQIFFRIVAPNIRGAITAIFLLSFADAWNELTIPFLLITNPDKYPASLFILYFIRENGLSKQATYSPGLFAAFSIIYVLPTIVIYIITKIFLRKNPYKTSVILG